MADLDSIKRHRDMVTWHRQKMFFIRLDGGEPDETHIIPYNFYRRKLRKEMIRLLFGA